MIYTDKKLAQQVIEYCAAYGVEHVVISPGSRNVGVGVYGSGDRPAHGEE